MRDRLLSLDLDLRLLSRECDLRLRSGDFLRSPPAERDVLRSRSRDFDLAFMGSFSSSLLSFSSVTLVDIWIASSPKDSCCARGFAIPSVASGSEIASSVVDTPSKVLDSTFLVVCGDFDFDRFLSVAEGEVWDFRRYLPLTGDLDRLRSVLPGERDLLNRFVVGDLDLRVAASRRTGDLE